MRYRLLLINTVYHVCSQQAMRSNSFRQLQEAVDAFVCEGYPLSALLLRLQEDIVTTDKITDAKKVRSCSYS
jgi:hypothetical protein